MTRGFFKSLYHFFVYATGILVLIAAVVITTIRILLPDIGMYRNEIEAWVSNYMDLPIIFHSIDANWQGWTPELTLKDIDLLNKAGTQTIIHFEKAIIRIAPVATLMERKFIPRSLVVSGIDLSIAYLSNGAIYIGDVRLEGMNSDATDTNELAEWFFKQDEIEISDARVEWIDIKNQQPSITLTNVSLDLRNDIDRLQVDGSATLPPEYGNDMNFAFDASGNLLSSDWSGELYLSGHNIAPENWYQNIRPPDFDISGGKADIKVWSKWENSGLYELEGELEYRDFRAHSKEDLLHINELSYDFRAQRDDEDIWRFHIKLKELLTENGPWPDSEIIVSSEPSDSGKGYRYITSVSYLRLNDLTPLIRNASFLPEKTKEFLADISIDGEMSNGKLVYDPDKAAADKFLYNASFDNLNTDFGDKWPSFSDLSGHIYGSLNKGILSLDDRSVMLDMPLVGKDSIQLTEVSGQINWVYSDIGWQLYTNRVQLESADLVVSMAGEISKDANHDSPFLDLIIDLDDTDLETITAYMPVTEKFRLKNWLQRSIPGGKLEYANSIFRGYLSDFPFDENDGKFKLIANISGATLDFSEHWPPIDQLDAEVIFEGNNMLAHINNGKIFNAEITTAKASISDVLKKEKTVMVKGHIRGITRDLSLFIEQSPLVNNPSIKETGNSINSGEFGLDLDLSIPVKRKSKIVDVAGEMNFSDVLVTSSTLKDLSLEELTGKLSFTNNHVSSETLKGLYFDESVDVTISGSTKDDSNPVTMTISGRDNESFITDRLMEFVPVAKPLKKDLLERISGDTSWQVKLSHIKDEQDSKLKRKIEIESELSGMVIDLPAPIGKSKYTSTPVKITTVISGNPNQTIDIYYGGILFCQLDFDKNASQPLQKAGLSFGNIRDPSDSSHAMAVQGSINILSLQDWIEILSLISSAYEGETSNTLVNDLEIDLQLSQLQLFNRLFSNVSVAAIKTKDMWQFLLDSKDIKGEIILPTNLDRNSHVTLDLERLYIDKDSEVPGDSRTDVLKMPALEISVKDLVYLDREMGEMSLVSTPVAEGISIDRFEFRKPSLNIQGNGKWIEENNEETSTFNIDLNALEMNAMLNTFGYDGSLIKDGETNIRIDANWSGSPMDFTLENLNGQMTMDIDRGQFLPANPSAGRLFGLLSIQALPRRLLLDFKDLFGKGLSFDSIEANFEIDKGNAYTNNLYMRGPAANVVVTGRAGLADEDLDQIATVTPQISETIPIAGAVFGPVGIGVGTLIYLVGEMFNSINSNIDKLLDVQYTITGSWNEPVIEKIKTGDTSRDSQAVPALAPATKPG